MATPKQRVVAFRSGQQLEEQWLIFGVTDGFSGTQQTFRTAECTAFVYSVWITVCGDDGQQLL